MKPPSDQTEQGAGDSAGSRTPHDDANQIAYTTLSFILQMEEELPSLRDMMSSGDVEELEDLLREWHEHREDFLKPLTAEQRRTLGV